LKVLKKVGGFFSFQKRMLEEHPIIYFAIFSIFENWLIESLSRHSFIQGFVHMFTSPVVFFYNALIIMLTISFSLLFRRRVFGLILLALPWLVCGIVNCVLLTFRVTPLAAVDFQIVKISMILIYLTKWQRILLYSAVGLLLIALIALWIISPKIKGKMHYGRKVASIAGVGVAVAVMTFVAQTFFSVGENFGYIVGAYDDYGFVYCFTSSVIDTGIDEPEEYDAKQTAEILEPFPETVNTASMVKPDIVLIQLESFVDAKTIKGMTFSDDPAPVHTYLREKYSTGLLEVPSFGGGTANTEFEVLSGINLDCFGLGEYPYKTILLKQACETMAFNLKESGYSAHAIHNHTGDFYDRDKVYPRMGFDSFQSIEYMYDYETTSYGWCKDKVLTGEIMTALTYTDEEHGVTEDTPRFVWTVSVQGHGAYPTEPIEGENHVISIKSENFTEEELCSLEYYINQAWEMDMFLGNLISVLETREKPTLLIAYGDHLPAIGLEDSDLTTENAYITEYVTWNNFGLEKQDRDLRTYELSAEIMSWLGFNNGNITKLHQYVSQEDAPLSEEEYQAMIEYLAYDMLYGENYQFDGNKPYKKQDMRMGTLPVVIEDIKVVDGALYIQGKGFTTKSDVFIDGEKVSSTMLSQYSLMVPNAKLKDGAEITVGQTDSKRNVLGYSNMVTYDESKHLTENK